MSKIGVHISTVSPESIEIPEVVEGGPAFAVGGDISDDGTYIIAAYTVNDTEENIPPRILNIVQSGTWQDGETITSVITVQNDTSYAISTAIVRVYGASDTQGTGISLLATITDITIDSAIQVTATYDIEPTWVGSYLITEAVISLAGGTNPLSNTYRSIYGTQVSSIPSALDVYDEWRFEFSGGALNNGGAAGAAILGNGAGSNEPSWDSGNSRYDFTAASTHYMQIPRSATWSEPKEILMLFQMKSTSGTQSVLGIDSNDYLRLAGTVYNLSGVTAGTADTSQHWIRIILNGASGGFSIDNGTFNTINTSGDTLGGANCIVGASTSLGVPANMYLYKLYASTDLLSAGEWSAVVSYLGI